MYNGPNLELKGSYGSYTAINIRIIVYSMPYDTHKFGGSSLSEHVKCGVLGAKASARSA